MPHPWDKKAKQMPHPRADKLINFKECTKLITCVSTIYIKIPLFIVLLGIFFKKTRKTMVFISDENIDERL
jgi:hypothetical protein